MKIYLMTDMEGVAGVLNFQDWTGPGQPYYELGKRFLTLEVNAAIDGFFEGGATEVVVQDGHGAGGVNLELLDPRAEYQRGWGEEVYPFGLDGTYDAAAWVGQHAKAGTEYGHMAHTGSTSTLDMTINGVSMGEFGELVLCASEFGVRTIFGSGDEAFCREAAALVPGIETAAVKRGVKPGTGDDLSQERYGTFTGSARHLQPVRARRRIREGALRAIRRAREEPFGLVTLTPPYEKVHILRPGPNRPTRTVCRVTHPSSVTALLNARGEWKPVGE